nr:hypothetical protein [Pseudomonadota bacterium]
NQYRSTQAFEAAEAGLEWTLARLNDDTRLGDDCLPSEAVSAVSFRDRHLRYDVTLGALAPATWNDAGTPKPLQVACFHDDSGWRCNCPASGAIALATPLGTSTAPAFVVELSPGASPGLVVAVATGCMSGTAICAATSDAAHKAAARIEVAFGLVPAVRVAPAAALTARGDVDAGDAALGLQNRDADEGGVAVDAGGHVAGNALRLFDEVTSGAHAYASIVDAETIVDGTSGYASNTSY